MTLPNQKTFTITAKKNGPQQRYIQSATLNGTDFDQTFIDHKTIANGGELNFEMDSAPNYQWGTSLKSRPVSPLATLLEGWK